MTKRPLAPASALHYPPKMPPLSHFDQMQLKFPREEQEAIRRAMSVYAESRRPKVSWEGWKMIGRALQLARLRARKLGPVSSRGSYGVAFDDFLRKTGFKFINKGEQHALAQCMPHVDEIDAWRALLPKHTHTGLNNPIDIWEHFSEAMRDGAVSERVAERIRKKGEPKINQLLEEHLALLEVKEALEAQLEEAQALLALGLGSLTAKQAERLSDEDLRRLFAYLDDDVQDALHARLFVAPEENILGP